MMDKYILLGKIAVPATDLMTWARWYEGSQDERRVGGTDVGCLWVSTMFLGLDHRFGGEGDPLLFETMIFGLVDDEYQTRCSSWQDAEKQHATAVKYAEELVAKADAVLNKKADQEKS